MSDPGHGTPKTEKWGGGAAYESYVGRWSHLVARDFLTWLNLPAGLRCLDVGCGTGILSQALLRWANPSEVKGIDPSEGFISFARAHVADERLSFEAADARHIPIDSSGYDVVVSGLVLNFIPDIPSALREMVRVTKPGGMVAAYVWDYSDQMQMTRYFWDAAMALDPEAQSLDQGRRFPICNPEPLTELFQSAGLNRVQTRSIDILTHFRDFEDYWTPFLGGQGSAPAYVSSLEEHQRTELRDHIQTRLPINSDGSIDLTARAWAVRGLVSPADRQ